MLRPSIKRFLPLILLFLAPIIPLCLLLCSLAESKKLAHTELKINILERKLRIANLQKEEENNYLIKIQNASPHFIDERLEALELLKEERRFVQNGQSQNMRFVEGKVRSAQGVREVEESQERAVVMNEGDLLHVLALVEGVRIGAFQPVDASPELFFRSLDMKKVALGNHFFGFETKIELIKREAIR